MLIYDKKLKEEDVKAPEELWVLPGPGLGQEPDELHSLLAPSAPYLQGHHHESTPP